MKQILESGFSALASFLIAWPLPLCLTRLGLLDRPNNRSSHVSPTPRGGGAAILLAIVASAFVFQLVPRSFIVGVLLLIMCLLGAVSFIDDIRPLGPSIRFGIHAASAIAILSLLSNEPYRFGSASLRDWKIVILGFGILFIWIAGYTNAFNFMDGINGIASAQAVLTGLGTGILGGLASGTWDSIPVTISFIVAGAAAGFIPHNFPHAKIFMGDVGSAPLGFILAALAVWLAFDYGLWLLLPFALLHSNFILDTGITLLRRIFRGERWYEAHRDHFYQRLVRSGKSHTFVTGLEIALQSIVILCLIVYLYSGSVIRIGLAAAVIGIWIIFFSYCERAFRKSPSFTVSV